MKQLLIQIDDQTFEQIEKIAPASSRRRSNFIRKAIVDAIVAAQEQATADAYRLLPDSAADAWFDARVWEAPKRPKPRRVK